MLSPALSFKTAPASVPLFWCFKLVISVINIRSPLRNGRGAKILRALFGALNIRGEGGLEKFYKSIKEVLWEKVKIYMPLICNEER
jgi:hypothetical protein